MPCSTGFVVRAAACAIGADPSPASLDQRQRPRYLGGMGEEHVGAGGQVGQGHERDQRRGRARDAPHPAKHHRGGQHEQPCRRPVLGNRQARGQRVSHRVGLYGVADAETGHRAEDCEGRSQRRPARPQTATDVVHRAAAVARQGVQLAIGHGADGFGVLRGHADQRRHPHPGQRAGATEGDGRGHAGDVARAHRRRQRRHQGLKRRDVPRSRALGATGKEEPEGPADVAHRHGAQADTKPQAGAQDQGQHHRPPNHGVDGADQIRDRFQRGCRRPQGAVLMPAPPPSRQQRNPTTPDCSVSWFPEHTPVQPVK
jgi:hypothetical protein